MAILLVGCAPKAFAPHEADLMREPPPALPTEANSYWNDRPNNTYGEFSVGPASYSYNGQLCRAARVTSLNSVTHDHDDKLLMYCAVPGTSAFQLNYNLSSCRMSDASISVSCRTPEGDAVVLPAY
jgi:hypothetical protein